MDNILKGKNVVVTGRMRTTRAVVESELIRLGANVQRAVTRSTDYLICGADVGERKTRAAEALGVKMLNADDYRAILEGRTVEIEAAPVIKPKMTHAEFVASLPDDYGAW